MKRLSAGLVLVGGILAVLNYFVAWINLAYVDGQFTSLSFRDSSVGKYVLIVGLAIVVMGVLRLVGKLANTSFATGASVLAVVLLLLAVLGIIDTAHQFHRYSDIAENAVLPAPELAAGPFFTVFAGTVALVGAVLAQISRLLVPKSQ